MIKRLVPSAIRRRLRLLDRIQELDRLDSIMSALGRIEARQLEGARGSLQASEFRVYSHAGEDGILQYLVRNIAIERRVFVEFGVEDYREANTRFLLENNGWAGLVMDASPENINRIKGDSLYWNRNLKAECEFITRENIDGVMARHGLLGPIGLLSVDIDGNDYWVLEAITCVQPAILVVEYNHRFGPERSVVRPYDPEFIRRQTDDSWLFNGASLRAIVLLAKRKGLSFVGCNSFGNNAFFVRDALVPDWMHVQTAEEGFVRGQFREAMLINGALREPTEAELESMLARIPLVVVE